MVAFCMLRGEQAPSRPYLLARQSLDDILRKETDEAKKKSPVRWLLFSKVLVEFTVVSSVCTLAGAEAAIPGVGTESNDRAVAAKPPAARPRIVRRDS